ncbi:MAG: hypothetical protein M0R77_07785 [Gammaproteobacteria bacterium]|nr:hypothetical protein [Gammaproteobacteria bacterium]
MKEQRNISIHLDREEGFSIREIARRNNCSTTTVQKVLKQTPPEDISMSEAVDSIYTLASRKEGVLFSEEYSCLKEIFGDEIEKGVVGQVRRKVKAKASKKGTSVLFIPSWLGREDVMEKRDSIMSLANELHERMYEYIEQAVDETGASWNECRDILLSLAIPSYSNIPVSVQCERIDEIIHKLQIK